MKTNIGENVNLVFVLTWPIQVRSVIWVKKIVANKIHQIMIKY